MFEKIYKANAIKPGNKFYINIIDVTSISNRLLYFTL